MQTVADDVWRKWRVAISIIKANILPLVVVITHAIFHVRTAVMVMWIITMRFPFILQQCNRVLNIIARLAMIT